MIYRLKICLQEPNPVRAGLPATRLQNNQGNRVPVCRTTICREQMISDQGRLERVRHTGTLFPLAYRPQSPIISTLK